MCSVGDAFRMDLADDMGLCEYKCNDCGGKFKGVRINKKLKCPECQSANTDIVP